MISNLRRDPDLVRKIREIVADGDAHGIKAVLPTSIGVRTTLELAADEIERLNEALESK